MLMLCKATRAGLTVKNSRFLAEATPVSSPDEARSIWREKKAAYDNGNHIVYAFITGPQGNIMGCSDDGEPSGTAGRPVLAVLKGSGITNVIITVARWFGGTKLGTGGLVKAYGDSAKAALEGAETAELVECCRLSVKVSYADYESVKRLGAGAAFQIENEDFSDSVTLTGSLPEAARQDFMDDITALTNGRAVFGR